MAFRNLDDARLGVAAQEDDQWQFQPFAPTTEDAGDLPGHGLPLGETMHLIPRSPPAFQTLDTGRFGQAAQVPPQQARMNLWAQDVRVRAPFRLPQPIFPVSTIPRMSTVLFTDRSIGAGTICSSESYAARPEPHPRS